MLVSRPDTCIILHNSLYIDIHWLQVDLKWEKHKPERFKYTTQGWKLTEITH